jgi:hypothetical protein
MIELPVAEPKTPIRPEESLAKMIASLPEKTGKSLGEWRLVIAEAGWQKHGEIMAGLKGNHGLSHGYANQIALRARELEEPAVTDPLVEIFSKRPEAKVIYDALLPQIQAFGGDVDLAPKKGYVSVRRKKQFAVLQPAAGRLDVGIQLKGVDPGERLEASGSFNAMLTHRVRVSAATEVDSELMAWLEAAYRAAG